MVTTEKEGVSVAQSKSPKASAQNKIRGEPEHFNGFLQNLR